MKPGRINRLSLAAEAQYLREHDAVRDILDEEQRITSRLSELDAQGRATAERASSTPGYRITGADIAWQAWETRTRRSLNTRLARNRVKRLAAMEKLAKAFGRKEAARRIEREAYENSAEQKRAALLAQLLDPAAARMRR